VTLPLSRRYDAGRQAHGSRHSGHRYVILGRSDGWRHGDQRMWLGAFAAVAFASETIFWSAARRKYDANKDHLVAAREQARRNVDEFVASLSSPADTDGGRERPPDEDRPLQG
jgi:hypothetical protein